MTKWEMLVDVVVWLSAIGGGIVAFRVSSGFGIVVNAVALGVGAAFGLAFGAGLIHMMGPLIPSMTSQRPPAKRAATPGAKLIGD